MFTSFPPFTIWAWPRLIDRHLRCECHTCINAQQVHLLHCMLGRGFKESKCSWLERHVWLLYYHMMAGMCSMHGMWIILYISRIHCYGYRTLAVYSGLLRSLNRRYIGDRYMWKRVISGVQADTVGFVWFHRSERELTFSCERDLLTARSTVKPQKYDWNSRWPVRHVRGFVAPTVEPCWVINHQLLALSLFEIRNKNPLCAPQL